MTLTFFQQQLHDVDGISRRCFGDRDTVQWRSVRRRFSDPQRGRRPHRYDLRDECLAIENGDGFPSAYGAQVFAEARLQFCDSHLSHNHMITINSHLVDALPNAIPY